MKPRNQKDELLKQYESYRQNVERAGEAFLHKGLEAKSHGLVPDTPEFSAYVREEWMRLQTARAAVVELDGKMNQLAKQGRDR